MAIGGSGAPGFYLTPGLPYVVTTSISSSYDPITVLSASSGNYLSYLLFDYATISLTLTNTELTGSGSSIKFGFTQPGLANSNYFSLAPQQSVSLPLRTGILYMSSSANSKFELIASVSSFRVANKTSAIEFISGTGV
jgi:hypothetical protein